MEASMAVFRLNDQNRDLDSKITAALERVSRVFRILMWHQAKTYRISPIQLQILIYLHEHGDEEPGVTQLATELGVTQPTVSDAVQTLVDKGHIQRRDHLKDRRRHVLVLTAKGRKITERLLFWGNPVRDVIHRLDFAEKKALWTSLWDLLIQLQQNGLIPPAHMCFTCQFFRRGPASKGNFNYHCALLDVPLGITDLRVDCPDHEAA